MNAVHARPISTVNAGYKAAWNVMACHRRGPMMYGRLWWAGWGSLTVADPGDRWAKGGEEFSFFSFSKAPPTFGIRVLLIRLLSLMYYYYIVLFPCNFNVYFTPVGSSSWDSWRSRRLKIINAVVYMGGRVGEILCPARNVGQSLAIAPRDLFGDVE